MNNLSPYLYPEVSQQYESACALTSHLIQMGFSRTFELGPVCSRDHAHQLDDLKKAVKAFFRVMPQPRDTSVEYRRLKQELDSILKAKP